MHALLAYLMFPALFYGSVADIEANLVPQKAVDAFNVSFNNVKTVRWFSSEKIVEGRFWNG
jgi:hypothetical protein